MLRNVNPLFLTTKKIEKMKKEDELFYHSLSFGSIVLYGKWEIHKSGYISLRTGMFTGKILKNFECQDIVFRTKDQIMLKGWYLPAKVDARKAMLLVHGYGVNRWKVFEQVPFLHQAGYNLLLFDLRAHGESEGKYCSERNFSYSWR